MVRIFPSWNRLSKDNMSYTTSSISNNNNSNNNNEMDIDAIVLSVDRERGHSYQHSWGAASDLPSLPEDRAEDNNNDDEGDEDVANNQVRTDEELKSSPHNVFTDDMRSNSSISSEEHRYDWRLYIPAQKTVANVLRWFVVGGASKATLTDDMVVQNLTSLAKCIVLLREYAERFGMPQQGGPKDQAFVLREVFRDLYAGGAPIWVLESVMQKAAEGLTGDPAVNWLLLPRKAFMSGTQSLGASTHMFRCERGFDMQKMDRMEKIATRLASYASNTRGFGNVPARLPRAQELIKISRTASSRRLITAQPQDAEKMAKEILSLASKAEGLFFFVNQNRDQNSTSRHGPGDDFWKVSEREQEIFSRLACIEAMNSIKRMDDKTPDTYPAWMIVVFRIVASAGATGFWFGGSWNDMWLSGLLAVFVASISSFGFLSKTERVIFETIASFCVGITAGLISLNWPGDTCYTSIALGGVLDILQGFRVVYAIIEIMSKNTLCGGANLLEGVLFTGLIAYSLQFGQYCAAMFVGKEVGSSFAPCSNGINQYWYLLFVPAAALSWSALFAPQYRNLPGMAYHGCLAYAVNWALARSGANEELNNFVSASCVTFSAGVISRFTGRQAVGNAIAGLYVLLPGAYLVRSISSVGVSDNFFVDIIQKAVVIGMGSWTGTILCSPTVLGTTVGIIHQQIHARDLSSTPTPDIKDKKHTRDRSDMSAVNTMLFF